MSSRAVVCCGELASERIQSLIARYGAEANRLPAGQEIPGSYWGAPEAGLLAHRIYYRDDTPVHSLLHELAHFVCMSPQRRAQLDTDAGGDDDEECGVCYLELLLAAQLEGFGTSRCLADMDAWGYSFREASARAWFNGDGRDARDWLLREGLIDAAGAVTWRRRGEGGAPGEGGALGEGGASG